MRWAPLLLACVLLLAGCAERALPATQEPPLDAEGAFRPRDEPAPELPRGDGGSQQRVRAEEGDTCLDLTLAPDLSALRPGVPLTIGVTLLNCGERAVTLAPSCGGHVFANLTRDGYVWSLAQDGAALADHCPRPTPPPRQLAPREALQTSARWDGFLHGDACGASRWWAGSVPAAAGAYDIAVHARTQEGLVVGSVDTYHIMHGPHESAALWNEGEGTFRTLLRGERQGAAGHSVIDEQHEWAAFCAGRALGWPFVDFARERVVVVRLGEKPNGCWGVEVTHVKTLAHDRVTFVHALVRSPRPGDACTEAFVWPVHAVSIPAGPERVELVLESAPVAHGPRFAPPHEPPTRDPPEPYDFDPDGAVHLAREGGVLRAQSGTQPLPACEDERLPRASEHADADGDGVWDDFQAHVDAQPEGARVSAIVGMVCPVSWNDVLALREAIGHFPVNALWSTGAQGFAADLTPQQVRALGALPEVRGVEGNHLAEAY